jgi:hypothetical protein
MLVGYLKEQPWWLWLQPVVVLLVAFVAVEAAAYEYVQWQYHISPPLPLFLRSYLSKQILIVFGAVALGWLLFRLDLLARPGGLGKLREFLHSHRRALFVRGGGALALVALMLLGLHHYAPRPVSQIRIKFMAPPRDVQPAAFAYLVYELNRQQRNWYFEVDFTPFNEAALTSAQQDSCSGAERPVLCYAEAEAEGQALIGITHESLGGAYFCEHRGKVSVISTSDKEAYAPLTAYEYLAYSVIVQSIVIHLDAHGGLPTDAFRPSERSHGGVFQFSPGKETLKPVILAARLSPEEEELLFNSFGAEYVSTCADLLSMEWLHSKRVMDNLEFQFGVKELRREPKPASPP